jgi:hypothetical protein
LRPLTMRMWRVDGMAQACLTQEFRGGAFSAGYRTGELARIGCDPCEHYAG